MGALAVARGLLDARGAAVAKKQGVAAVLEQRYGAETTAALRAEARSAITLCATCKRAYVRAGRPEDAACVECGAMGDETITVSEPELPSSASTPLVDSIANKASSEPSSRKPEPNLVRVLRAGDRVGEWTIERQIGRGGMGLVYAARRGDEPAVALKVMAPGLSARSRERFLREGAAAARLEHPAIAKVLGHGESQHGPWIAMELVDGKSLSELGRTEGVTDKRALEIVERIARALDHAHRRGVIHRDLKPGNVLIAKDGAVKVVDFGLAKDLELHENLTSEGTPVGTPGYMAPEQVEPRTADAVGVAADVHAIGTLLYELATGTRPFRGRTRREVFQSIMTDPVEPLAQRAPRVRFPKGLEQVVQKALAKRPGDRYLTARELADDISALRRGHPPQHVNEVTRTNDPALSLKWGDRIGPYEVRYPVGVGAAAVVFKAAAPDGSAVALKVLRPRDRERLRRFEREVRLLSRLTREGPGFVPLVGHGATIGGTWLAMPFLPRGTLRDRLERGPLPVEEAISVVKVIATAMARAHASGITHRDLKPENILFTEGDEPLIADLGLARPARDAIAEWSDSITVSREGRFMGTAGYAAPEQLDDARHAGPPADVFALGAVLYECVSGLPPFEAPNAIVLTARLAAATHQPLSAVAKDAPAWLVALVEKALAADPAQRYADAAALVAALDARTEGSASGLARKALESVKKLATRRRRKTEGGTS